VFDGLFWVMMYYRSVMIGSHCIWVDSHCISMGSVVM
jgi:hypothetical protein